MEHKNVVTLAVLVLASFSLHASKPSTCSFKPACVVVKGIRQVEGGLNNSHVNAASNALVLGTAAYAAYTYGPNLAKSALELIKNFRKPAAESQADRLAKQAAAVAQSRGGNSNKSISALSHNSGNNKNSLNDNENDSDNE